ncbi:MAG TPA: hypothetical protein EYN96_03245, partial [Candidatus Hydrogenedentes bacterium]|nr:hypothetical protein [Candidatus Hydrogenedentota bacterium]
IAPIVNARGPLFVHPKGLVKRTTFHVMQMYANELGSTISPVAVTSSNLPGIAENIAAVDAITTIDPGSNEWKVALINRHPESSASISLQFGDKNIDGEVAAIVLSGDSPDAFNDVDHPNRVAPRKIRLTIENGMIDVPPHSLIIIAIQ